MIFITTFNKAISQKFKLLQFITYLFIKIYHLFKLKNTVFSLLKRVFLIF